MENKKYLSLERLKQYDTLIKTEIAGEDEATLSSAKSYTNEQIDALTVSQTTKKLSASATGAEVAADGTAKAITALGTPTTATAITDLNTTTINNPTVTEVTIPNVTGNESVTATKISSYGTLPSWSASVADGVLSFDFSAGSKPAGSDVSATNVTLGEALSASSVSTSNVTVATGSKATAAAITGFGEHTTADALTGVKMSAQPTITLSDSGATGVDFVSSVAIGSTSASLTKGE